MFFPIFIRFHPAGLRLNVLDFDKLILVLVL